MKQSAAMNRFIHNTNALREARGLTIQALADAIGMQRPDLSNLLNGKHSPSLLTLERIAEGLGVDPVELITEPSNQRRKIPATA